MTEHDNHYNQNPPYSDQPVTYHEDMEQLRGEILNDFASCPSDDAVWQEAYQLVQADGDDIRPGEDVKAAAANIPGEALIAFAERMHDTPAAKRYDLTTETAPDGQLWFDVLRTFSSPQLERAKITILHEVSTVRGYGFNMTLDVGTGNGKSLAGLEAVSDQVIGLDKNQALLGIAACRKAASTRLFVGAADALPFASESFDLVSSSCFESGLSRDRAVQFYQELGRILTTGGTYVGSSFHMTSDGYPGHELADILRTSKAMLADMIVDTISGKMDLPDFISPDERIKLLEQLGLQEAVHQIEDSELADGSITNIHLITKPA